MVVYGHIVFQKHSLCQSSSNYMEGVLQYLTIMMTN